MRANSPNGKICTAHIGTGGKGRVDTAYLAKHKRTWKCLACATSITSMARSTWSKQFKSATAFQDYREMLAELGDKVDAVSISTPDLPTTPATLAAMELGKNASTLKNHLPTNYPKPGTSQSSPEKEA